MVNESEQALPVPRRSKWDNDLPAGDSPPLPSWPLKLAVTAYSVWMVFLIAMAMYRLAGS